MDKPLPLLSIAMVTYERTDEAIQTIQTTCKNLKYPLELRSWYLSDDGSKGDHASLLADELRKQGEELRWFRSERERKEGQEATYYAGMGWNKVLGNAHQNSDFVLWLEDDWVLDEPLDLAPFVRILQKREDVGIMSFRILSIETDVCTKGYDGKMYVQYSKTSQYAYSGNPLLRHARFVKHYGWFAEDKDPGNIELDYDSRYRMDDKDGPWIWRPLDISPWGAWKHIGTEKTWK